VINNIASQDPFGILESAKMIADNSRFVVIDESRIANAAKLVRQKLEHGLPDAEDSFGTSQDLEQNIQIVFFLDVVNFSFWPDLGQSRWQVSWPEAGIGKGVGGWYSLVNVFKRAMAQNVPILDAKYLSNLSPREAADIFIGDNNIQIPMLPERVANLREAGAVLSQKFDGHFAKAAEAADYDAIKITKLLCDDFPSFRDVVNVFGKKIVFLKRAQICANDLSYLFSRNKKFKNIGALTAFADYRLPQILREIGVLIYNPVLSAKVDNCKNLPALGQEEIEIRSATIWAVELVRKNLKRYNAAQIDNALWLLSQERKSLRSHHRTRTIFY
jgi:hypothetical protein